MVALDIRQESTRHADALDAITNHLGIGSYKRAFWHCSGLALLGVGKGLTAPNIPMNLFIDLQDSVEEAMQVDFNMTCINARCVLRAAYKRALIRDERPAGAVLIQKKGGKKKGEKYSQTRTGWCSTRRVACTSPAGSIG